MSESETQRVLTRMFCTMMRQDDETERLMEDARGDDIRAVNARAKLRNMYYNEGNND